MHYNVKNKDSMEDNIIDILQSFKNDSEYSETQAVDDILALFSVVCLF